VPAALLDVNVLVALFDPEHVHHEAAHRWFGKARRDGWATCGLTEAGLIRVLASPAYAAEVEPPAAVAMRLRAFCDSGGHAFWSDVPSLRDRAMFRLEHVAGHRQLTDVLLLGTAVRAGGRLATFDRAIPVKAVAGAKPETLIVIGG